MDLVFQSTAISQSRLVIAGETSAVIPTFVDEATKFANHRETRTLRSSSSQVATFDPKPNRADTKRVFYRGGTIP